MRFKFALLSLLLALPAQVNAGDTSGYERQPPARASSTTYTPANASHWQITPSYVSGALDTLASVIWHNDFAVTPSLTATVVGDEVVISVPGIAGKTINWTVTSGV